MGTDSREGHSSHPNCSVLTWALQSAPRTLEATLQRPLRPCHGEKKRALSPKQVVALALGRSHHMPRAQCRSQGTLHPKAGPGLPGADTLQGGGVTEGEQGSESDQPGPHAGRPKESGPQGPTQGHPVSVLRNRAPVMCNSQTGASRPGLGKVCS